jgi:hypothetical protein
LCVRALCRSLGRAPSAAPRFGFRWTSREGPAVASRCCWPRRCGFPAGANFEARVSPSSTSDSHTVSNATEVLEGRARGPSR